MMATVQAKPRTVDLTAIVLRRGAHGSRGAGMCVMEAVAYVAGAKHSDRPPCASQALGDFLRAWNDDLPNDDTRTRLLRPLVPRIVDTAAPFEIEQQRRWLAVDWFVRTSTPAWLETVPALRSHAVALRALPPVLSSTAARGATPAAEAAQKAARAAGDAAWAALEPTVLKLQASAIELVERMIEVCAHGDSIRA
jgi:hypothetical protein